MKKSEIDNYLRKKIGLANRPTHEDVRNAMKSAYNSGAKNYKSKASDYKNKATQLGKLICEQFKTNQAVANLIKAKDKEIETLKWTMGKSVTEFMLLNSKEEKIRALAQTYLGMLPKDKGCKNWNDMQKLFAKDVLKIVNTK